MAALAEQSRKVGLLYFVCVEHDTALSSMFGFALWHLWEKENPMGVSSCLHIGQDLYYKGKSAFLPLSRGMQTAVCSFSWTVIPF